jgi:general secretion pathway protein B
MSYILDALKKSDQQRQRGATPTLQAAQLTVAAPKRPLLISYGLLAAVLLVTGIMIGWLRPWQAERQPPAPALPMSEAVAAKPPLPIMQQATAPLTAPAPSTTPPSGRTAQEGHPATNLTPAVPVAVPAAAAMKNNAPVDSGTPGAAAPVADDSARLAAPQQKVMRFDELPVQIQREIPAMTVQLHAYSSLPSERIVYINSTKLQEGDYLIPGLMLEQITPDGMIFSYKGYRFQHGIR